MPSSDFCRLALDWLCVPLFFFIAFSIARSLRPESRRAAASEPGNVADRCRRCGAWQARHLTKSECWACGSPIAVSAQDGEP